MNPYDAQITFISTTDLDATSRFYEDVLGLELALDQGSCRIYRAGGDAYLGFCQREEAPPTEGIILTLVTDDVDGCFEHVAASGARVEQPPALDPTYAIYHFFVRDPMGYRVEVQRFEDPRWAASR